MRHNLNSLEEIEPEELPKNRVEMLKNLAISILQELENLSENKPNPQNLFNGKKISLCDEVQNFESELIRAALIQVNGNQRRAAKLLNTKITTLNAKIKRYRIEPLMWF